MIKSDFVRADGMVPIMTPDGDIIWEPYEPEVLPDGSVVNPWDETPVANDPIDMSLAQFRQLPDSGVITMDDIRKEVSVSGTCNLNQQEFRDLIAPRNSGEQQAMSEYYGKSAVQLGEGEIGTGGNCFGPPVTSGDRNWGINEAWSRDGYCGWYNKIRDEAVFALCISEWELPWMSVRNRQPQVRISYRSMVHAQAKNSYPSVSQFNALLCGDGSTQGDGYWFNPQVGANQGQSNRYNGAFIMGDLDSNDYAYQRCMMNNGAVGNTLKGDFSNDKNGCEPEYSWINKCGIANDPSRLPNNGNDPEKLRYQHYCYYGNYVGAQSKTLYIRMETA